MAMCPQCNNDTMHAIKTDDPSVLAKCRTCGSYRYKKVKMTQDEFDNIVYSMVQSQIKESNVTEAEVLAYIVRRTGHTTQEITDAYNRAKVNNQR